MNLTPDYSFQIPMVKSISNDLKNYQENLLAAAPGAGKTNMVIDLLSKYYLPDYPDHKVIILSHGQTILRDQWIGRFNRVGVNFSFQELISGCTVDLSKQVFVAIPQFFTTDILEQFKNENVLLIVDEAHQYYFAKNGMVEKIVDKIQPISILCLTGTPSDFIKKNTFKTNFISPSEVASKGVYSYVSMELSHSPYSFSRQEYHNNGNLKNTIDIKQTETYMTLDNMLRQLDQPELKKTMVICSSQKQALDVERYFIIKKQMVALSISDIDADSGAIKFFTEHDDCNILVVVNRGILGFDCPEIMNLLDLKCSYNPNVIMQYLARIFRLHPTGRVKKRYLRAINGDRIMDEWHILNFMVNLMEPENFTTFDGEMMDRTISMQFPVIWESWSNTIDSFFLDLFRAVRDNKKLPSLQLFNGKTGNNYGDVTLRQLRDFEKNLVKQYNRRMAWWN